MDTGVYHIRNKINNKLYIGSASKSIKIRWKNHLNTLRGNRHVNKLLQRAFNKYGEDAFEFKVISEVEAIDCIKKEQELIDKFNPFYNICKVAASRLGTSHSEETKQLMSKKRLNKLLPQEVKDKVSLSLIGNQRRLGIPHTDEAKKKMSESRKGKPNLKLKGKKRSSAVSENMRIKMTGRKQSQEQIKKSADRRRGQKRSAEQVDRFSKSQCKFIYTIIRPDGITEKTMNLISFSKKYRLSSTALGLTFRGYNCRGYKVDYHKGYKIIEKESQQQVAA